MITRNVPACRRWKVGVALLAVCTQPFTMASATAAPPLNVTDVELVQPARKADKQPEAKSVRKPDKPVARAARKEEAVDLSALGSSADPATSHGPRTIAPNLKVYFDLNLVNRPGLPGGGLSFENYHSFLFYEIAPSPQFEFSFDISPNPKFYELDYQITPAVRLRAGRIWIPFDDLSPHGIFGGRVATSRLSPNPLNVFLPDIWADLGIGIKVLAVDTKEFKAEGHLAIVNGFGSGADPYGGSDSYPSFTDSSLMRTRDNNRAKSVSGRIAGRLYQTYGLGASFYQGRWSDEATAPAKLSIFGLDGSARFSTTELRAGLATMAVELLRNGAQSGSMNRGGAYAEIGQNFGSDRQYKLLVRAGMVQLDNRFIDVTDQTIAGATLLWRPGWVEYSLHYSRDLKVVAGKQNYSYTALRMIVML